MDACRCKSLIFPLLIIILFISQTPVLATAAARVYTNFIKTKCNITTYPSLCLKTLTPYASSVKTNSTTLCKEALKIAIKGARDASIIVSNLKKQKGISRYEAMAIIDCIVTVKTAVYQLKRTIKAIGHLDDEYKESDEELFRAKTYAGAALTDAETCIDGFSEHKVNPNVKKVIDRSMAVIIKLGSNALSFINDL